MEYISQADDVREDADWSDSVYSTQAESFYGDEDDVSEVREISLFIDETGQSLAGKVPCASRRISIGKELAYKLPVRWWIVLLGLDDIATVLDETFLLL